MTSTFDKLRAILRRDLLTAIRHRSGFVVTLVGVFTELAAFYFLSRAIGPGFRPGGIEYFPFLLVGTGVYTFFVMSTQAFLGAVQEAQQTGTLEVLMTTSTRRHRVLSLSSGGHRCLHFLRNEHASFPGRRAGSATDGNAGSAHDNLDPEASSTFPFFWWAPVSTLSS